MWHSNLRDVGQALKVRVAETVMVFLVGDQFIAEAPWF